MGVFIGDRRIKNGHKALNYGNDKVILGAAVRVRRLNGIADFCEIWTAFLVFTGYNFFSTEKEEKPCFY